MPDPKIPKHSSENEPSESFGNILSQFEKTQTTKPVQGLREGTVVTLSAEGAFLDVGLKTEGILPLSEFVNSREPLKRGRHSPTRPRLWVRSAQLSRAA